MKTRDALMAVLLLAIVTSWSPGVRAAKEYDVLDLPAVPSDMATKSLIFSIRKFDGRHFAVGHQGHILFSDDGGDTWTQAEVPVRSSILDVHFPTPEKGWAVGHEGVILHSSDGGKTWVKQYDGIRYGVEGKAFYEEKAAADPNNPDLSFYVDEMDFAIQQGADKPLFKVYFLDENRGYAVGAYGMILNTLDGGKTWTHRLETVENDSFYHVFDFAPLPGEKKFFLAGESGLFLVADVSGPYEERHARRVTSVPWEGSFFTSVDTAQGAIVVGGLRGRMFLTSDAGDSWTIVEKPPTSAIVDSTRLANGNLLAVGIAGEILMSTDDGLSFAPLPLSSGGRIYAVEEGSEGTILVGGPHGIQKLELPK
jgi:photosystem II stability/assembly factor-like uncharacterized protein